MPRDNMAEKETNQKKNANAEEPKKVVTRYEKRLQRRKEEEALRKKNRNITVGIAAAVVAVCVGVLGYRAYDNYQEKYGPYMSIGSHKISQTEYNYYYNNAINSFYSQYGSFASYFGLDLSKPLDQQYYSDTQTWKDYFDEQAVTQMQHVYALSDEAKAQSFGYDAADDVEKFVTSLTEGAESAEMSVEDYCIQAYGEGAKLDDVKKYVELSSLANAYYDSIEASERAEITSDEVQTYYDEHKNDFDSVDYLACKIEADIPEPETAAETEAETVAETETETAAESAAETEAETETVAETEDNEAEVQAAMNEAKAQADAMKAKVKDAASFEEAAKDYATDAEAQIAYTDTTYSSVSSTAVADWLFEDVRNAGDCEVIEDTNANAYYVVFFQDRYLDHIVTRDVRHILIQPEAVETPETEAPAEGEEVDEEAQAAAEAAKAEAEEAAKAEAKTEADRIYKEWQDGEATEDSFAALAEQYTSDEGSKSNGGLYEHVKPGQMVAEFNDWVFDDARKTGDTAVVETSYGYHIMYYVGTNDEAWYADVTDILVSDKMSEYMDGLTEKLTVSDPRGHLPYLKAKNDAVVADESETAAESGTETETAAETETEKK